MSSEHRTTVLSERVCDPADSPGAGDRSWRYARPLDPTTLWSELTARVVKRVPDPVPNLGYGVGDDGVVDVVVNLGLWIAVNNPDDIVARIELDEGVWAQARATLSSIEFDSGTGGGSGVCAGAGTPLPDDELDVVEEGPCGYTYRRVDELGEQTAVLRATWAVVNTASTGASERRPDIVLETEIPVEVTEIVTVGVATP